MSNLVRSSALILIGLGLGILPARAEKVASASLFQPRQSSRPARTLGGATRNADRCAQKPAISYVGLKDEKPTLAWQVNSPIATQAEVALFNSQGKGVYQSVVSLSADSKEVIVNLPQNLKGNEEYQWVLSLICQPNDRLKDQSILGWIEFVPVNK